MPGLHGIRVGEVAFLKGFRHHTCLPKGTNGVTELDFNAPARGKVWAMLLVGVISESEAAGFSPEEKLNNGGWYYVGENPPCPKMECGHPKYLMHDHPEGAECPWCASIAAAVKEATAKNAVKRTTKKKKKAKKKVRLLDQHFM